MSNLFIFVERNAICAAHSIFAGHNKNIAGISALKLVSLHRNSFWESILKALPDLPSNGGHASETVEPTTS